MSNIDLNKGLFFDIETHRVINWGQRSPAFQKAFINHYYDPESYTSPEEHYSEIAGLYAELSQVICIVFGYICPTDPSGFKTFAIYGGDEVKVLEDSRKIFDTFYSQGYYMIGWNSATCDVPFTAKRYILNGLKVPDIINEYGVKPWETWNLDAMNLWKFGDYKRTSLEMVCAAFGVNCKTDDIGGDNMYTYDIKDMPWNELVHYCTEDVVSLYQVTKRIVQQLG